MGLIAIMGDTYQRVQENALIAKSRERAALIYEAETLALFQGLQENQYLLTSFSTDVEQKGAPILGDESRKERKREQKRKDRWVLQKVEREVEKFNKLEASVSQALDKVDELERVVNNQASAT